MNIPNKNTHISLQISKTVFNSVVRETDVDWLYTNREPFSLTPGGEFSAKPNTQVYTTPNMVMRVFPNNVHIWSCVSSSVSLIPLSFQCNLLGTTGNTAIVQWLYDYSLFSYLDNELSYLARWSGV